MMRSSGFRRHLRQRLLSGLGLGVIAVASVPACGGEAVIDPPLGSGGASSSSQGTTSTVASSSSGVMCTETTTTGGNGFRYSYCLDGSCPDVDAAVSVISQELDAECCIDPLFACEELRAVECGPFATSEGSCCFEITTEAVVCAIPGRPLTLDGRAATAPVMARRDWLRRAHPQVSDLTDEQRSTLAIRWREEAQLEHASVASFARFALELMAVGAPPSFIEDAHAAAMDEVRHATLAFALASAYAGHEVGPGPMALPAMLPITVDLTELAVATFREACVNETVAAVLAAERLERATDPAVREVLTAVAEDESRHAELGWRFLAWALGQSAAVHRAIEAEALRLSAPEGSPTEGELGAHGQLDPGTEAEVTRLAIDEVVRPALKAALAKAPAQLNRSAS